MDEAREMGCHHQGIRLDMSHTYYLQVTGSGYGKYLNFLQNKEKKKQLRRQRQFEDKQGNVRWEDE